MTTLKDLEKIIPDSIERMRTIKRNMSRYKKLDTDYRAKTLMNEIDAKINQVESVYELYKTAPSYKTKNFDNYVNSLNHYVDECQRIYEKIMAYESVAGYK